MNNELLPPPTRQFRTRYQNIPYAVDGGPWKYTTNDHVSDISEGINCQFLFHQFLDATTGFRLSEFTLSKEIYEDDELFVPIAPTDGLQVADAFLFGKDIPEEELDPRTLHIAAFTGMHQGNQPLLIHHFGKRETIDENGIVTSEETGLQIWTREQFREPKYAKYYGKLWAVKRFDPEVHLSRDSKEVELDSVLSFFKNKIKSASS